jgi:hypothetical protein
MGELLLGLGLGGLGVGLVLGRILARSMGVEFPPVVLTTVLLKPGGEGSSTRLVVLVVLEWPPPAAVTQPISRWHLSRCWHSRQSM